MCQSVKTQIPSSDPCIKIVYILSKFVCTMMKGGNKQLVTDIMDKVSSVFILSGGRFVGLAI